MSTRHRLFFALEPDDAVRERMQAVQKQLAADGRAVRPEQFHVTLAFLGMQPSALIPELRSMASRLVFEPCTVVLDRIGNFRQASVLWLGSSNLPAALQKFQKSLIEGLEQAGVDRDRKSWELHVTLYRRLRKLPRIMEAVPVSWALDGFSLIESVSVRSGVEYHRRGRWGNGSSANFR